MTVCVQCGTLNVTDVCVVCGPVPFQEEPSWQGEASDFSKASDFDHLFNTPEGAIGGGEPFAPYGAEENRRQSMPAAPIHSSKTKEKFGFKLRQVSGKLGTGAKRLESIARSAASPLVDKAGKDDSFARSMPEETSAKRMQAEYTPSANSIRPSVDSASRQRYHELFPEAADHDRLGLELWCKAVDGSDVLEGIMFVTRERIAYAATCKDGRVAVEIPFKDVLDVRPGEVHWGSASWEAKVTFSESSSVGEGTNSLRLYTRDQKVHIFFDCELVDSFSRWLSLVYYYWGEPSESLGSSSLPSRGNLSFQPSGTFSPTLNSFEDSSRTTVTHSYGLDDEEEDYPPPSYDTPAEVVVQSQPIAAEPFGQVQFKQLPAVPLPSVPAKQLPPVPQQSPQREKHQEQQQQHQQKHDQHQHEEQEGLHQPGMSHMSPHQQTLPSEHQLQFVEPTYFQPQQQVGEGLQADYGQDQRQKKGQLPPPQQQQLGEPTLSGFAPTGEPLEEPSGDDLLHIPPPSFEFQQPPYEVGDYQQPVMVHAVGQEEGFEPVSFDQLPDVFRQQPTGSDDHSAPNIQQGSPVE